MPAEPTPKVYWFKELVCHEVRARGEAFPSLANFKLSLPMLKPPPPCRRFL